MLSRILLLFSLIFVFGFSGEIREKVYVSHQKIMINEDGIFLSSKIGLPVKVVSIHQDEKGFYFYRDDFTKFEKFECELGHPGVHKAANGIIYCATKNCPYDIWMAYNR